MVPGKAESRFSMTRAYNFATQSLSHFPWDTIEVPILCFLRQNKVAAYF